MGRPSNADKMIMPRRTPPFKDKRATLA